MECMRVQIDRDPQAEGYFSAYSPSLGRVALRKTRYLESNPGAGQTVTVPGSDPPDDFEAVVSSSTSNSIPSNSILINNFHSTNSVSSITTASNSNTPIDHGRLPAPAPPNSKPAPATHSIFGAKLQQALHDERK
jgi:hypothetical protein